MQMRILLIPPKNNYPDPVPRVDIFGQGFPYIAGALKRAGHEVFGINMNYLWCGNSAQLALANEIGRSILEYQPDIVGIGGLSGDYSFVKHAIEIIRKLAPELPIVVGGGMITYDQEYIFSNLHPDFCVHGEAESTIVSLVNALAAGDDYSNLNNIAYWKDSQPIHNEIVYENNALEDLVWPDYTPFNYGTHIENFYQTDKFYCHTRQRPRIMPITLGRSCPYKCTFCVHQTGAKYRQRSVDDAIKEIEHFYNIYEFNILFVYDELLSVRRERVIEFSEKIGALRKDKKMDFDWTCDLRVKNVDEEMLKIMKETGCSFIGYGLESASPDVLTSMKKGTKVSQIERAIDLTSKAEIGVQGNFIFGDPAETMATIKDTLGFFTKWCSDLMVFLSHIMAYPGSEIFQYCIDNGIIVDKQDYYNKISLFGSYKINMTQTPDEQFFTIIEKLEKMNEFLPVENARVISTMQTDELADPQLPMQLRRQMYQVEIECPHCSAHSEYLYPVQASPNTAVLNLRIYCAECHKRIGIPFKR